MLERRELQRLSEKVFIGRFQARDEEMEFCIKKLNQISEFMTFCFYLKLSLVKRKLFCPDGAQSFQSILEFYKWNYKRRMAFEKQFRSSFNLAERKIFY